MTTSLNTAEAPLDVATLARLANALFQALPGPATPGPLELQHARPPLPTGGAAPSPTLPVAGAVPTFTAGGLAPPRLVPDDAALRDLLVAVSPPRVLPRDAPHYIHALGRPEVPTQLAPPPRPPLDVNLVRRDFPILAEQVDGKPLIWLDNAATTQKPQRVIDRLVQFYSHENSNIHRAAHTLAARATDAYEAARVKVQGFLHARSVNEIVFVRGATEAINLVAASWGEANIGAGDNIVISHLEHHANIVPWQRLAEAKGAQLQVIPVDDSGQLRLDALPALLGPRTKLVAITQVANALGTVTPVAEVIAAAHAVGARVLVDGAQAVSHLPVDVVALDADWYVFSGHKVFGPTGIGVLYGKQALLDAMPPWQSGGTMIADVTLERATYQPAPARFEAGTGNIADAVGLGAAIDYVTALGLPAIAAYEHGLLEYGTWLLRSIPGLRLIGTATEKASVLSFVLDGHATADVGAAPAREGIAVRAGHHCAQPILRRFGLEATVRPSLAFYNTCAELEQLAVVLRRLVGGRARIAVPAWPGAAP